MKAARLVPRADRLLELRPTCAAGLLVKLIAWVIAAIMTAKQVTLRALSNNEQQTRCMWEAL